MIRKANVTFDSSTSTGLDVVPINSSILIEDSDGSGEPKLIFLTSKTSITSTTTISDLLTTLTANWKPLGGGSLESLSDTDIDDTNTLAGDDLLQYNSTSGLWENVSEISGGTY